MSCRSWSRSSCFVRGCSFFVCFAAGRSCCIGFGCRVVVGFGAIGSSSYRRVFVGFRGVVFF